jgi:hypothetical protein
MDKELKTERRAFRILDACRRPQENFLIPRDIVQIVPLAESEKVGPR